MSLELNETTICFAHSAYRLKEKFDEKTREQNSFQVRQLEDLAERISDADVLVVSGFWRNSFLESARRLRYIQSIGAGTDQFPKEELRKRGIKLASARGVNTRAVAEHAIGHMLALTRRLSEARDNQTKHIWRGMIGDPQAREDEVSGKTLLLVGLGTIGSHIAKLAKAFDLHVIAIRRDSAAGSGPADSVHGLDKFSEKLPSADFVVLACPLTPETTRLINAETLGRMKKSAFLINVARGGCVDEPALVSALASKQIAGAGIDVTVEEPLSSMSPLWDFPHALITPHTGGETSRYEGNVIAILEENLKRLKVGDSKLLNQIA